jgi:hypothetical protein
MAGCALASLKVLFICRLLFGVGCGLNSDLLTTEIERHDCVQRMVAFGQLRLDRNTFSADP